MITGAVTAALEATIPLRVRGAGRRTRLVQAVIDTGFDGSLTLPPAIVMALGLPRRGRERGVLADGSVALFHVYDATVVWDGRRRPVLVAVAGGAPLVGTALLAGHELTVDFAAGGSVRIGPLPVDSGPP